MEENEQDREPETPAPTVGEAEAEHALAEARVDVAEVRQEIAGGNLSGAESRLRDIEDRLAEAERRYAELRQTTDGKADREHIHPLPGELQTLSDALGEIDHEERVPERRPWLYRKLGSKR